jgi:hypothetical protein
MNPRLAARVLGAGRAALGAAILVAPEAVTSHWLGEANASHPAVRYLSRSLGARDLALGVLVLSTVDDARFGPQLQAACAMADSVDALATLAAREHIPKLGAIGTVTIAGAAALAGVYLARALADA